MDEKLSEWIVCFLCLVLLVYNKIVYVTLCQEFLIMYCYYCPFVYSTIVEDVVKYFVQAVVLLKLTCLVYVLSILSVFVLIVLKSQRTKVNFSIISFQFSVKVCYKMCFIFKVLFFSKRLRWRKTLRNLEKCSLVTDIGFQVFQSKLMCLPRERKAWKQNLVG